MADVCVVYARDDAKPIPAALERDFANAFSVWWDAKIVSGDYREAIQREIGAAGCLVPIWSASARLSGTMHDEVSLALHIGIPVLPLRIHSVQAPLGFGTLQAVDALGWDGRPGRPEIGLLKQRVGAAMEARAAGRNRPADLGFGTASSLPLLWHSVSSHETQVEVPAALEALDVFGAPAVLLSAYDMAAGRRSRNLVRRLEQVRSRGGLVLLDSGHYEKTRKGDAAWTRDAFHEALRATPHDLALCFDGRHPPGDLDKAVKSASRAVHRDAKRTEVPMLPIAHLPRSENGKYRADLAPELVRRLATEFHPPMIAIPERELGAGLFARVANMLAIRRKLDEVGFYQPIHLLGTGNPISVALLAAAGADSFDGLEWCRFVVDAATATLHHFQLFELFKYQAQLATSPVTAAAVSDDKVNYAGKALLHNLDFYTEWMERLRGAVRDEKRLVEFMTELLPKGAMAQARAALPGIL